MSASRIRGGIQQAEASIVVNSGAATQLTITHPANNTAARVMTLPDQDANFTLISRDSSDTGANRLQNKELSDDNVFFVDAADTTKKIAFDISPLTTATTRVFEFADGKMVVGGNINDDDIITKAGTQDVTLSTFTIGAFSGGEGPSSGFAISNGSLTTNPEFNIQASGKAGLNVTTPLGVWHIRNSGIDNRTIYMENTADGGSVATINIAEISGNEVWYVGDGATTPAGNLFVDVDNNRVGINDSTPSEALDVTGNINATGNINGVSPTEMGYLAGTTSDIQTQFDAKLDDFSSTNDHRLVRTDGTSGDAVQESTVVLTDAGAMSGITSITTTGNINGATPTEVGYLSGVSSAIQTQLDAKLDDFSSTTDNALVRTNGTGGDAVQDSGITIDDGDNVTGVGSIGISGVAGDGSTGQLKIPSGGTAQRSGTPADGMIRYNSDLSEFEGYKGGWGSLGTGISGPGSSTNTALVRWDGTGGSAVLDSGITVDGSDNVTGVAGLTATGTVQGGTVTDGTASITSGAVTGVTTLTMSSNLTVDTNTLFVNASTNRVGIGTASPGNILEVTDTAISGGSGWALGVGDATFGLNVQAGSTSAHAALSVGNAAASATHLFVRGDGNVGIGTSSPGNLLEVSDGTAAGSGWNASFCDAGFGVEIRAGASGTHQSLYVQDAAGTLRFSVKHDGVVGVSTGSWGTGGTAIGVSGGLLTTSPSSMRYKENITDISNIDTSKIYDLVPHEFDYTNSGDHSFGYLAEEVALLLPCLVHSEPDPDEVVAEGEEPTLIPESVSYAHLSVLLVEEIKKLRDRIAILEG